MSAPEAAAAVAVIAVIMYAAFGGADFGGGIWTLLANGPRRNDQRQALERAIGPVWETNHVWLILLIVTLFVAFPTAYAAIFSALYLPLFGALLGIVARGAAFAFRHYSPRESALNQAALRAFSIASLLTPVAFGAAIGAVTGGRIEVAGGEIESGAFAGWLRPFALLCGLIGLLVCAFIGAAYMVPRTTGQLRQDFRRRALVASLALGAATSAAIPIAHWDAAEFASRLDRTEVVAAMTVTAMLGMATLVALARGYARPVALLAASTVAGLIASWALALNPDIILPGLPISESAAPGSTVNSFLLALPFGALVLVPSLALLYLTFSRETFAAGERPDH